MYLGVKDNCKEPRMFYVFRRMPKRAFCFSSFCAVFHRSTSALPFFAFFLPAHSYLLLPVANSIGLSTLFTHSLYCCSCLMLERELYTAFYKAMHSYISLIGLSISFLIRTRICISKLMFSLINCYLLSSPLVLLLGPIEWQSGSSWRCT